MPTRSVAFHGIELQLHSDDSDLLDVALRRFAALPADGRRPAGILRFDFVDEAEPQSRIGGRLVYESERGAARYDEEEDVLFVEYTGVGSAVCLPRERRALIRVDRRRPESLWVATRPLFGLALMELLKRDELYVVHAAGVATDERVLLLAGASGSGKSTLAVALGRSGFGFLGDDTLFLRAAERIDVLAFPDEIDLSDASLDLLGHDGPTDGRLAGTTKSQLRAETAGSAVHASGSAPAALIFPRVGGADARLEERAGDTALLELAANILLTERQATQRHLDALARLSAVAPAFTLTLGPDLAAAVALVSELARELRPGDPRRP